MSRVVVTKSIQGNTYRRNCRSCHSLSILVPLLLVFLGCNAELEKGEDPRPASESRQAIWVRAGAISNEVMQRPLPEDAVARAHYLASLGYTWPFSRVERTIAAGLADPSPQVRLIAAQILLEKSDQKYRENVLSVIRNLDIGDSVESCRLAVLKHKLGEPGALQQLYDWSTLTGKANGSHKAWMCAFHGEITSTQQGVCPICDAELIERRHHGPEAADLEAQELALNALADRMDPLVAKVAKDILTDDVPGRWRGSVAVQWARIDRDAAHPHVKLFLESTVPRLDVLNLVVEYVPEQFVAELRTIAKNEQLQAEWRLTAVRGLIAAGDAGEIGFARRFLVAANSETDAIGQHVAIHLLGDFGGEIDLKLLEAMLDTDHREAAASAIVRIIERTPAEK